MKPMRSWCQPAHRLTFSDSKLLICSFPRLSIRVVVPYKRRWKQPIAQVSTKYQFSTQMSACVAPSPAIVEGAIGVETAGAWGWEPGRRTVVCYKEEILTVSCVNVVARVLRRMPGMGTGDGGKLSSGVLAGGVGMLIMAAEKSCSPQFSFRLTPCAFRLERLRREK